MSRYIVNGEVYIEHRFLKKTIKIEDGKLIILPPDAPIEDGAEVYNATGKKVVPGFIDVHTHGAVGVDVNAATAEDYEKICRFATGNGTTSWLCSVLTDTKEQTEWCIDEYKKHQKMEHKGANLLGIHLEGMIFVFRVQGGYAGASSSESQYATSERISGQSRRKHPLYYDFSGSRRTY